jgi:S-(hydroxymethyl)glutathione dehydrogenase/alcohol dehydrogenase
MKYPLKYKAAILYKTKSLLKIEDIIFEGPLKLGQVLVKVLYTGICGKQIEEISGKMGKDLYLPHCLGHEATGRVVDIGSGVTKVKKKDCVVLHWMKGSGIQSDTPDLKWRNNKLNAGCVTTFSEYTVVSENRLTKISKKFDLKVKFKCILKKNELQNKFFFI